MKEVTRQGGWLTCALCEYCKHLHNGEGGKIKMCSLLQTAVITWEIKMYSSMKAGQLDTHHHYAQFNNIHRTSPSSSLAAADALSADLANFVYLDSEVKQAVSIFGFNGNQFQNCNDD